MTQHKGPSEKRFSGKCYNCGLEGYRESKCQKPRISQTDALPRKNKPTSKSRQGQTIREGPRKPRMKRPEQPQNTEQNVYPYFHQDQTTETFSSEDQLR